MNVQEITHRYHSRFVQRFGHALNQHQWSALNAMEGCRQGQYGELAWSCQGCEHSAYTLRSCGHRACNQCQQHSTENWLQRQETKLLPVTYYMATFTLPRELRGLAKVHPKAVYTLLMRTAAEVLNTFARNDPSLAGELGLCSVLHTHTRRLDYHPHVHIVIPGGALNKARREWRKAKDRYLFNGKALAKAFRGAFLRALSDADLTTHQTPKKWVVQCQKVGKGLHALRYLSRYLYRGVISNRNLIADDGENITFRYRESKTNTWKTRTMPGEEFIHLLLQHCLPKGFRRTRDYGFLHGNAKSTMSVLHWIFRVIPPSSRTCNQNKAKRTCPCCHEPMFCVGLVRKPRSPG